MKLILASASSYRQALLKRLEIPFTAVAPDIDESPREGEPPGELSLRLATEKARVIAQRFSDAVVIGSDQVASLDGELLGKPGSFDRAFEQLRRSSGRRLEFHTGLCQLAPGFEDNATSVPFTVHFRELTDAEIQRYLELEQPFDCAGSFKCEGLGISLFERLEGDDPTALEGLPLIALCQMLGQIGMHPLRPAD
ncbi:MAG: Maf family protein [Halieaceae bacterium]